MDEMSASNIPRRVPRILTAIAWASFLSPSDGFVHAGGRHSSMRKMVPTTKEEILADCWQPLDDLRRRDDLEELNMNTDDREDSICKEQPEAASDETGSEETEDTSKFDREAVRRAALLSKGNSRRTFSRGRATSVGNRRIGSATKARQGSRKSDKLLDTVRKTAVGKSKPRKDKDETKASVRATSVIQQAIDDLIIGNLRQRVEAKESSTKNSFGLLGEPNSDLLTDLDLGPNLRLASPMDHVDVARLRLSVFNEYADDMSIRSEFCARSCSAIACRKERGALCIVATTAGGNTIGSIECSVHEFYGTRLGEQRPEGGILYITEVAVHPSVRRQGIGADLLAAADALAAARGVESLYLHVDTSNAPAIALYRKAGYELVDSSNPIYLEFTTSLNLHPGGTRGRTHFLFCKHVQSPTWLIGGKRDPRGLVGSFGFDIPA